MERNRAKSSYIALACGHFPEFAEVLKSGDEGAAGGGVGGIASRKTSLLHSKHKQEEREAASQKYLLSLSEEDRKVSKAYQVIRQGTEAEHISPFFEEGVLTAASTDAMGNTPLHICCDSGFAEGVRYLLDTQQPDVTARNMDGETPVLNAALVEAKDVVLLLLQRKGTAQALLPDKTGDSARSLAEENGWHDVLELF